MNTLRKIKDKLIGWRGDIMSNHHKLISFLIAILVVGVIFFAWLMSTNQGWIARDSFAKTFDVETERVITVYGSNGEPVRQFLGTYHVEFFNDKYIVVMNQKTGERINVYGSSTVIIDESPDFDHSVTPSK